MVALRRSKPHAIPHPVLLHIIYICSKLWRIYCHNGRVLLRVFYLSNFANSNQVAVLHKIALEREMHVAKWDIVKYFH